MPSHLANRVAMASRIIDWLDANLPADTDLDATLVADWDRIAHLAGETHTPSPATQAAIITGLRQRRRPVELGPHLLAGLPQ